MSTLVIRGHTLLYQPWFNLSTVIPQELTVLIDHRQPHPQPHDGDQPLPLLKSLT